MRTRLFVGVCRRVCRRTAIRTQRWTLALALLLGAEIAAAEPTVLTLHPAEDSLWLGTSDGVVQLRRADGRTVRWAEAEGLPSRIAVDIDITAAGEVWVATPDGPARHAGNRFVAQTQGLDTPETTCLLTTPDGALYAGTARGLAEWDGSSWHMRYETHEFGRHRVIAAVVGGDGTRWFAKPRSLMRLGPDGRSTAWFNDPLRAPAAGGLAATAIDAMRIDPQGRFWLASAATLEVRAGDSQVALERYRPGVWGKGGLPRPLVRDIEFDANGAVWLVYGELEQRFASLRRAGDNAWIEVEVVPPTAIFDLAHDDVGTLWAATANGLYRFDSERRQLVPQPLTQPLPGGPGDAGSALEER